MTGWCTNANLLSELFVWNLIDIAITKRHKFSFKHSIDIATAKQHKFSFRRLLSWNAGYIYLQPTFVFFHCHLL